MLTKIYITVLFLLLNINKEPVVGRGRGYPVYFGVWCQPVGIQWVDKYLTLPTWWNICTFIYNHSDHPSLAVWHICRQHLDFLMDILPSDLIKRMFNCMIIFDWSQRLFPIVFMCECFVWANKNESFNVFVKVYIRIKIHITK